MGNSDWAKANPEKDAAKSRLYYARHRDGRLAYSHAYYQNHKDRYRLLAIVRHQKDPDKDKARGQAKKNVILGENCVRCGSAENLDRHHPDYAKPLEVITLCRRCHATIHLGLGSKCEKVSGEVSCR